MPLTHRGLLPWPFPWWGHLSCFLACPVRAGTCVASGSLPSSVPGRVSFFTSGSENLHRVEKVRWGTRYAVTIAFTCNPDHGIADPELT